MKSSFTGEGIGSSTAARTFRSTSAISISVTELPALSIAVTLTSFSPSPDERLIVLSKAENPFSIIYSFPNRVSSFMIIRSIPYILSLGLSDADPDTVLFR